jgi:hypothetical protein
VLCGRLRGWGGRRKNKLATIKSMPYQTLARNWISDKIRQELNLAK